MPEPAAISSATILLIEDNDQLRVLLEHVLTTAGYRVVTANDGQAGIDKLKSGKFDLVVTDLVMPEKDGTEVILYLRTARIPTPSIAISAYGERASGNYLKIAKTFGARAVLEKPFTNDRFLETVAAALQG